MLMTEDAPTLTHVGPEGQVRMVDVSGKRDTVRTAVAAGRVRLGEAAFDQVKAQQIQKGDVLATAQIAGIMGAKQTSALVPLCHNVLLKGIDVDLSLNAEEHAVDIRAFAKSVGATGVEMEAITAVSVAAITVYDMCKSVSKDIEITNVRLLAKTGGQGGDYRRVE